MRKMECARLPSWFCHKLETQMVKLKTYFICKPLGFIVKVVEYELGISFGTECACSMGQNLSLKNCPISSPGVVFINYCDYTDPQLGLCKCPKNSFLMRFVHSVIKLGWGHLLLLTVIFSCQKKKKKA